MATVRGSSSIYTRRVARRQYRCDGPHDTYAASDQIMPGDVYWRSSMPPHSEFGNLGWWTHRLCFGCAPVELTMKESLRVD